MGEPDVPRRAMKLVLVGNANVGKTCITRMATFGRFEEESTPTIGASYLSKELTIGGTNLQIHIWDTAGQERFRGLTPLYFRDAQASLVTYSITDHDSFDGVTTWMTTLNQHADPQILLFLVGNKCDLDSERAVTISEAEAKAEEIGARFFEVSAKSGQNVQELFLAIGKGFLESGARKTVPAMPQRPVVELADEAPQKTRKKCC
jgi:Ras-related protein Rab-5C